MRKAYLNDLIGMVARCVLDDVGKCAPQFRPSSDNDPTIVVKDPWGDKE